MAETLCRVVDVPPGPPSEVDVVVTVTGLGAVSAPALAALDPDLWTLPSPLTEPLAEFVGGPVAPPALAEVKEYREDVDMRLSPVVTLLATDSGRLDARSGTLLVSLILLLNNLGVSYSSTADSLIVLLVVPSANLSLASLSFLLKLIVLDALLLIDGRGRGREKLTLSA